MIKNINKVIPPTNPNQIWETINEAICKDKNVYRILVSKKDLTSHNKFGFLKYTGSPKINEDEISDFNPKKLNKLLEIKDSIELGPYRFNIFKSYSGRKFNYKDLAIELRNSFNWFLVLNCNEKKYNDNLGRIGDKFLLRNDKRLEPHIKAKKLIKCDDIGAKISPVGQCLLPINLDFTKRALKKYQESVLEHMTKNRTKDTLRILSFNLSNFKEINILEDRISKNKTNVTINEEAYHPFGKTIEQDNIVKQINDIINADADIICLQQATESIEYREEVNNYFSLGAGAQLGRIFRNAYPKGSRRLNKKQIEEMCAYNLGMIAFQYIWRTRELFYLFKKISLIFLVKWLLEAHSPDLDMKKILKPKLDEYNSQFEDELRIHKLEVRQLYAYRKMILDKSDYIIINRPEIIETVLKFKKDKEEDMNLWKKIEKSEYYKSRFSEEKTPVHEIIKQLIDNMKKDNEIDPSKYDQMFTKQEYSTGNLEEWDKQKRDYLKEIAIRLAHKSRSKELLIPKRNPTLLRSVFNYTSDNEQIVKVNDGLFEKIYVKNMLKEKLDESSTKSGTKTKTLTNSELLSGYNMEKVNFKPTYKSTNIKKNKFDDTVKDDNFNSTQWAQEECYRIINMHNGMRNPSDYTTEKMYTKYRHSCSFERDPDRIFIYSNIQESNHESDLTKSVYIVDGPRKPEHILNPKVWHSRKGKVPYFTKELSFDGFPIVADSIMEDREKWGPVPNYEDLFDEFQKIWKKLIEDFSSPEDIKNHIKSKPDLENEDDTLIIIPGKKKEESTLNDNQKKIKDYFDTVVKHITNVAEKEKFFNEYGYKTDLWYGVLKIAEADYEYPEKKKEDYKFECSSQDGGGLKIGRPKEKTYIKGKYDPTEQEEQIDWVNENVWKYFTTRYLKRDDNDTLPCGILNHWEYYKNIKLLKYEEDTPKFKNHTLEIFDNILGRFFKDEKDQKEDKNGYSTKQNPIFEAIINREMYEGAFNNILNECVYYTSRLDRRMRDMRDYINDYVISQRSWLEYHLGQSGYLKHSSTNTGLALFYRPELKNGKKIIFKNVKDPVGVTINGNNGNVLVGQKTELKIGGKNQKSTLTMNILNIDMQFFDEPDLKKLHEQLEKYNFTNPTIIAGTFPTDDTLSPKLTPTKKIKNKLGGQNNNIKLEDVFDKYIKDRQGVVYQKWISNNSNPEPVYSEITDLLTNSDDQVSNRQLLNDNKKFDIKSKVGLGIEGAYVYYNTSSRHMGIVTDFKVGEEIKSTGLTGGKSKQKSKVRKHKGIIQIGGSIGKLRKGYKYSGIRLKSGLAEIVKVKSNKKLIFLKI